MLSFLKCFNAFVKEKKCSQKFLILAFEENKKIKTVLRSYEKYFDYIICSETNIRSSMPCMTIRAIFSKNKKNSYHKNLYDTIINTLYKLESNDILVIIGSHFIAPALEKIFQNCFAREE